VREGEEESWRRFLACGEADGHGAVGRGVGRGRGAGTSRARLATAARPGRRRGVTGP
jgi:hypothetical protein